MGVYLTGAAAAVLDFPPTASNKIRNVRCPITPGIHPYPLCKGGSALCAQGDLACILILLDALSKSGELCMPNPTDPRILASRPEYYLNDLNLDTGEYGFLRLNKDAYRRSAFMDHRIKTADGDVLRVPLAEMQQAIDELETGVRQTPINYILHSAFCCSTLIARCLDIEGFCCALREPAVLMQLANYKRVGNRFRSDGADWHRLLDAVLFLLAKSRANGEAVLIKPTNAANNLAADVLQHPRTGGVVLLYSSLEQFLVSIIKKGEAGRAFVRRLFNVIRRDSERTRSLPVESLAQLTDMQTAAFVWYLQIDAYLKLLAAFPDATIRTLDCDAFLTSPLTTLVKLCHLFEMRVEKTTLEAIVAGPGFTRHSKDDSRDYDSSARTSEYEQIVREHRVTLDGILAWSEGLRPEGPIKIPLARAL